MWGGESSVLGNQGAADRNRTCNPQLRRLVLYPVELPPPLNKNLAFHSMARPAPNQGNSSLDIPETAAGEDLKLVGAVGFELTTTWSQTRCATRLRYAPKSTILCCQMRGLASPQGFSETKRFIAGPCPGRLNASSAPRPSPAA